MTVFDQYFNRDSLISIGFRMSGATWQDYLNGADIHLCLSADQQEELLDALWDTVQDELWQEVLALFPDEDEEWVRGLGAMFEVFVPEGPELLEKVCKQVFKNLSSDPKKWRRQHEATWQQWGGFDPMGGSPYAPRWPDGKWGEHNGPQR